MTAVEPGTRRGAETATAPSPWRSLLPGQRSEVRVHDLRDGSDRLVAAFADAVVEAPNWTADGLLLVNRDGLLATLEAEADGDGALTAIDSGDLADVNNDHVLDPDGRHVFASSGDGHLYRVPLAGGAAVRVTDEGDGLEARYLHGVAPDGSELAFIGAATRDGVRCFDVYTQPAAGGPIRALTRSARPHDGAEYSPDGAWIYLNSERASEIRGHAQLFRMRRDGSGLEQLTADARVNWFPHLSPDGERMLYLSYEAGTIGHPANRPVELRLADPDGSSPRTLLALLGGQGTVNVASWAPDSQRFAYVAYPVEPASPGHLASPTGPGA